VFSFNLHTAVPKMLGLSGDPWPRFFFFFIFYFFSLEIFTANDLYQAFWELLYEVSKVFFSSDTWQFDIARLQTPALFPDGTFLVFV
jgi:hypothetical protein